MGPMCEVREKTPAVFYDFHRDTLACVCTTCKAVIVVLLKVDIRLSLGLGKCSTTETLYSLAP